MASETTTEKCGCGAEFVFRGDSIYGGSRLTEWRTDHHHIEPATNPTADDLAAKTAELAYRAARMDEEAAAMRRDLAKRQLRAALDQAEVSTP